MNPPSPGHPLPPLSGRVVRTDLAFVFVGLLLAPIPLRGDGGALRIANLPMGAYRVSVFTAPTPIPPDSIDVSVLATYERGRGIPPGLEILVEARRVDGGGPAIRRPATREQADDPRYYAAKFSLGEAGEWEVRVELKGPDGEGSASFRIVAREPGLLQNPWVILSLALLPLLPLAWWIRSPSSRPEG